MAWQTPAIVIRSAARSRTERVVACTLSGSPASRRIALTILRSLSGQRFGGVGMVSFDTYTAHPVKRLDVLSPCPTCSPGSPGGSGFAEMPAPIEASRRRTGSALLARPQDYEVGCIMISQPVFFARDDWVADHADWHPRIQGGKTIDVARGDGQRVLAECLERTARLRQEAEPLADELRRYGAPHTVQPRLGQGTFRIAVTSAYGACAALGRALAARARGRARASLRGRRRTRAPQRLAAARRHPPPLRRRLRHDHARLPFPRQPRPRRRLPQWPRVRALRRPRHHRAACAARPARPRAARLARGRGVHGVSVTHRG